MTKNLKKKFLKKIIIGFDKWKTNKLKFDLRLIIFTFFDLEIKKFLLFNILSYNSLAPSIDWDAPWAKDGGSAKNASPVRLHNRCKLTGRPKGYIRQFGVSRVMFREMANKGLIPGVTKASW